MLAFIEEVIGQPAYVAGNSLGGFIGTNLAANHPGSVLGLALMNATPFWAFRKPVSKVDEFGVQADRGNVGTSSAAVSGSVTVAEGGVPGGTMKGVSVAGEGENPGDAVMGGVVTGERGVPGGVSLDVSVAGEGGFPGDATVTGEGGVRGEGSGDWLKWDGVLPAPDGLFRFGAWYFDRMRDPRTVKSMLGAVYSNPGEDQGGREERVLCLICFVFVR